MNPLVTLLSLLAPDTCISCGRSGSVLCRDCVDILWYPPSCFACGHINENSLTCKKCRSKTALNSVTFSSDYAELGKELVRTMKFRPSRIAARDVSRALHGLLSVDSRAVVSYIPTPPSRIRERGFDHARLIARLYSRRINTPFRQLLKRKHDVRQVGANKTTRIEQMKGAFESMGKNIPHTVILIDDVVTTGATIESAARALKKAGVKEVHGVVFARTV